MKLHISNPYVTIELQTVEWATIAKSSFFQKGHSKFSFHKQYENLVKGKGGGGGECY